MHLNSFIEMKVKQDFEKERQNKLNTNSIAALENLCQSRINLSIDSTEKEILLRNLGNGSSEIEGSEKGETETETETEKKIQNGKKEKEHQILPLSLLRPLPEMTEVDEEQEQGIFPFEIAGNKLQSQTRSQIRPQEERVRVTKNENQIRPQEERVRVTKNENEDDNEKNDSSSSLCLTRSISTPNLATPSTIGKSSHQIPHFMKATLGLPEGLGGFPFPLRPTTGNGHKHTSSTNLSNYPALQANNSNYQLPLPALLNGNSFGIPSGPTTLARGRSTASKEEWQASLDLEMRHSVEYRSLFFKILQECFEHTMSRKLAFKVQKRKELVKKKE
jgi:hypothetical protein